MRSRLSAALARRPRRPSVPAAPAPDRSTRFREDPHDRFWWHKLEATDYVPPLYGALAPEEWAVMEGWYAETGRVTRIAEINVPAISFATGLVGGNGLRRVVQLGHYYGYSALLLGFLLRRMGAGYALQTIDLDPEASAFTQKWVDAAGLQDQVEVLTGDSADPVGPERARAALGGGVELLLVDSSHAYAHTKAELDLWVPSLPAGAIVLLHDATPFAAQFDPTGDGGVHRALAEWLPGHPEVTGMVINGHVEQGADGNALTYKDACGLGILQKLT